MKRSRLLSLVITLYGVSAQAAIDHEPPAAVTFHEINAMYGAIEACNQALPELETLYQTTLKNMASYLRKDPREQFTNSLMNFNKDLCDPKKDFDTSFADLRQNLITIKNNVATKSLQHYDQDMCSILTMTRQALILNNNIELHHHRIIALVRAATWMSSEQKLECLMGDGHGFYEYKKEITQYMVEHEGKDHNGIAWYYQFQGHAIPKTPLDAATYKKDAEFISYLKSTTYQRIRSLTNAK